MLLLPQSNLRSRDARHFVNVFLLAVNSRYFFVEMICSPLRQFLDRVYSGGSEKLSV